MLLVMKILHSYTAFLLKLRGWRETENMMGKTVWREGAEERWVKAKLSVSGFFFERTE